MMQDMFLKLGIFSMADIFRDTVKYVQKTFKDFTVYFVLQSIGAKV